jgi:hypothetical protein
LYFCSEPADNGIFERLLFISERTEKMVADTRHYHSGAARRFIDRWRFIGSGPVYLFIVLNENEKRNHNAYCNNCRFPLSFFFAKKLLAGNYRNGHLFARIFHTTLGGTDSPGMDGAGENIGLGQ